MRLHITIKEIIKNPFNHDNDEIIRMFYNN